MFLWKQQFITGIVKVPLLAALGNGVKQNWAAKQSFNFENGKHHKVRIRKETFNRPNGKK